MYELPRKLRTMTLSSQDRHETTLNEIVVLIGNDLGNELRTALLGVEQLDRSSDQVKRLVLTFADFALARAILAVTCDEAEPTP